MFEEIPRDTTRCVGASKSTRAYMRTRLGIQLDVQLGARVGAQVGGEQRGAHIDGPGLEVQHGAQLEARGPRLEVQHGAQLEARLEERQ